MDTTAARQLIGRMWDDSIIPKLVEYICAGMSRELFGAATRAGASTGQKGAEPRRTGEPGAPGPDTSV